jgi:hypothetical protein
MKVRNSQILRLILVIFIVTLHCPFACGKAIFVDDDGPADFSKIQDALDDAKDGDIILVQKGYYQGLGNINLDFHGKVVTLKSEMGPPFTTIECSTGKPGAHRAFYFHSGETSETIVQGFTITKGGTGRKAPPAAPGGAILCEDSSPTIRDCIFEDNGGSYCKGGAIYNHYSSPLILYCVFHLNLAGGHGMMFNDTLGGAIYNEHSNPALIYCAFIENLAESGGAIFNYNSDPNLVNCDFAYNHSTEVVGKGDGGAIYNMSSDPNLINCVFYDNWTHGSGAAMLNMNSSPRLTNCTIFQNKFGQGNAIESSSGSPILTNCIVWDNIAPQITGDATVTYSDVQGGWPGAGNINENPLLFFDHSPFNYVLLRLRDGSPCIDAGNNKTVPSDAFDLDLDLNRIEPIPCDSKSSARFIDDPSTADAGVGNAPIVDIGADEFGNVDDFIGDLDQDGDVNGKDFSILGAQWHTLVSRPCCISNLFPDGTIDAKDLALLVENWLKHTD